MAAARTGSPARPIRRRDLSMSVRIRVRQVLETLRIPMRAPIRIPPTTIRRRPVFLRSTGCGLLKPPYGRITGYDMNQGTIAFQIPNGDTPPNIKAAFEAAGLKDIPPTGSPSQAHLLVTKNFLFATEGSGGQAILHAYDKKTGAPIWQGNMPSGPATGIPMGYSYQGKQYILHAARGPQGGGAQIVAWTTAPAPAGAGGGGRGGGGGRRVLLAVRVLPRRWRVARVEAARRTSWTNPQ